MTWQPIKESCELDPNCQLIKRCDTQENLINSQFYFNSATTFNDPFDLNPFFELVGTPAELRQMGLRAVKAKEKLTGKKARRRVDELISLRKLYPRRGQKLALRSVKNALAGYGVCCFTKNGPESILMWAQYGDKHKGICVEYNFPEPLDTSDTRIVGPVKVNYVSKLPVVNLLRSTLNDWLNVITCKSLEWQYEQEYRIISRNYTGPIKYQQWMVQAIYAGCKMADREFEELVRTTRKMEYQPRLYKMKQKEIEYGLESERV